jgi:IclR family transcriptional regulator, KDG regulon repressor
VKVQIGEFNMEPLNKQTGRKVIASLQHAINILNLFDDSHAELGNSDIARILNMDPGTVAGLVYTLKINSYLDQNPENRKYHLGLKLVERASVLLGQIDLRKIAGPILENLLEWSGESVNLGVRDHQEVVYIERLFGSQSLGIRSELGKRAPLHSTALGKALLSRLDPAEVQSILKDYLMKPVTPKTITQKSEFLAELEKVRRDGYALDEEENELGGRCLAAPVIDHLGKPIGAISISAPIQRLPKEKIPEFGEHIKKSAETLSHNIGYMPR